MANPIDHIRALAAGPPGLVAVLPFDLLAAVVVGAARGAHQVVLLRPQGESAGQRQRARRARVRRAGPGPGAVRGSAPRTVPWRGVMTPVARPRAAQRPARHGSSRGPDRRGGLAPPGRPAPGPTRPVPARPVCVGWTDVPAARWTCGPGSPRTRRPGPGRNRTPRRSLASARAGPAGRRGPRPWAAKPVHRWRTLPPQVQVPSCPATSPPAAPKGVVSAPHLPARRPGPVRAGVAGRSEEHTSELQSLAYLVC